MLVDHAHAKTWNLKNLKPSVARKLAVRHTIFVCLIASFLATGGFIKLFNKIPWCFHDYSSFFSSSIIFPCMELFLVIFQVFHDIRACGNPVKKDFLSGALLALLFSGAKPFMQFWKRESSGTFMWSSMKFGPVVQAEMSFKEISYLELWQPFVQWTESICAILEEGIMRMWKYFEFGPMVQENAV